MKRSPGIVLCTFVLLAIQAGATDYYVDASRPDDSGSGLSWATAKQTIQAAVNLAVSSDTVYVAGGTYDTGATPVPGYTQSNRVYIAKAITLEAVDGPDATFIVGAPASGGGLGADAVRCMFVGNVNARIYGFTFTNGFTSASGIYYNSSGGGLSADNYSTVVVSNCVFTGNKAWYGGGFSGWGTAYNCTFTGNTATADGGGASASLTAYDCNFIGNSAYYGGGGDGGTWYRCTFTGNHATQGGGGLKNGIAHYCTFLNNTGPYGGGKYYGQAYDSTFAGNTATHGGGAYDGMLMRCTFTNNTASNGGGGVANGDVTDCVFVDNYCYQYGGGVAISGSDSATRCLFRGNYGQHGGGMYGGIAESCTFVNNSAYYGGGIRSTTARNSIISGNTSRWQGGGTYQATAVNCTITGNTAEYSGGGSYQGTLNNCIAWYNRAPNHPDLQSTTANYSCSPAVSHGSSGCITNAPLLSSHSHLGMGSPCVGAGSAAYVSGTDIDGEAWASPPAMGCDQPEAVPDGPLTLNISGLPDQVLCDTPVVLMVNVIGQCSLFTLDLDDGNVLTNTFDAVTNAWTTSGTKAVILTAFNSDYPGGVSVTGTIQVATLAESTVYVATTGNDSNDGSSWTSAKATIQAGVDAQVFPGAAVLVSNGTYVLTAQIEVDRPMTIRSLSGPAQTIVDGSATSRCFYLDDVACSLEGFTVTNGFEEYGGGTGIYCYDIYEQVVSNCVITGNTTEEGDGAGMYYGIAIHCIFYGNHTPDGSGGGMAYGRAINCLFANNTAYYGGATYDTVLNHCTVVGNAAKYEAGGTCYGYMTNCIVWNNTSTNYPDEYPNVYDTYGMFNCSTEVEHGVDGCITNAPLFVGPGNFRLADGSPCIDAGTNLLAAAVDLDGNPRISGGFVDMGAYEFSGPLDSDGDGIPDEWESLYYGGPTNAVASAPAANGINTVGECYIADLDPTAPDARFFITGMTNGSLMFDSSMNREYSLLWRTNLMAGAWTSVIGPRSGNGAADSMPVTNTLPQGYYRLQVELP